MAATGACRQRLAGRRVLFVSEAAAYGGHEQMAVRAAALLSRRGIDVAFRLFGGNARLRGAIEAENRRGAAIAVSTSAVRDVRLNPLLSWLRWHAVVADWRFLVGSADAVRVLVQGRIESGSVALLAARLCGAALVSYLPMAHCLTDMGVRFLPRLRDAVNVFYYRSPAAYVTISRAVERQLRRFAPRADVRLVENWIPPADPRAATGAAALRSSWGLPPQARVVAVVGRVDFQQKGHDLLLDALRRDAAEDGRLAVCVVGDGPDLLRLKASVEDGGLATRFVFVPWLEGGMDDVYGAVDAVALPSRYEGVPLVMLEALARGVPVAGADADGMADWLPAPATAPAHDAAALLAAVRYACDPPAGAYAAAFARARRSTDEDAYAQAWADALADFTCPVAR